MSQLQRSHYDRGVDRPGKPSGDRATPMDLFLQLGREFRFGIDVCANVENHKHPVRWYGRQRDGTFVDGLVQTWPKAGEGACFMNPPYDAIAAWVLKAAQAAVDGSRVVGVIPARVETHWWRAYCTGPRVERRVLHQRVKFDNMDHGSPIATVIVIWHPIVEQEAYEWSYL